MADSDGLRALEAAQRFETAAGISWRIAEGGKGRPGRPVVLISGWPQTIRVWRYLFAPLSAGRHVIAVEPPGLGDTEPLPAGHDSKTVAAAILALLTQLGVHDFDLVGHDIGTWLGYPMAHLGGDRVARMVVVDAALPGLAPPTAYALEPERLMKVWHFYFNAVPELPAALTAGREGIYIEQVLRTRSENFAQTFTTADVEAYVRAYSRPGAMDQGFAWYRAIFKNMADNQAFAKSQLRMPILAVGGASWLGPVMEATFKPLGQSVSGLSIAGSAHFVPEEQPEAFGQAVEAFLQGGA